MIIKFFEILVKVRLAEHFKKFGSFPDFQYGFRSSQLTAALLVVVCDSISKAFNASGATKAVTLHIPRAFKGFWHSSPLYKVKS